MILPTPTSSSSQECWQRADCRDLYREIIASKAVRVGKRGRAIRCAINRAWTVLGNDPTAQVLEFGVHTGRDMCLIDRCVRQKEAEQNTIRNARCAKMDMPPTQHQRVIHGFDSFEGLPEDWDNGQEGDYDKGKFDLGGVPPCLKEVQKHLNGMGYGIGKGKHKDAPDHGEVNNNIDETVVLHAGWFEDTVSSFFDDHPHPIGYIHADADLHSSTITFLEEICRRQLLVKGSVITFDEYANYPGWEKGEYLAWAQMVEKYNIDFQYIYYHSPSRGASVKELYNKHGYQSVTVVITKVPW